MVTDANDHTQTANDTKPPIPPLIFIAQELNFNNFIIKMNELTNSTGFKRKATTKGQKLQTFNSDSYRAIVKYLKKKTRYLITLSRTKKNKPYREVIKNLHPTTDTSYINNELSSLGF
jgi:hypothetical protein